MTEITAEALAALDSESRYDYFLTLVADERELWILINANNEFLKVYAEDEDFEYLPVWPSAGTAELYAATDGASLVAKAISLPEFFKKWVPGLQRDQMEVGVMPADDGSVWVTAASELQDDIQDAMTAF